MAKCEVVKRDWAGLEVMYKRFYIVYSTVPTPIQIDVFNENGEPVWACTTKKRNLGAEDLVWYVKPFLPDDEELKKPGKSIYDLVADLGITCKHPGVCGTIGRHFYRKNVVAYAKETCAVVMIIKLRNSYTGALASYSLHPMLHSNIAEVGPSVALRLFNDMKKENIDCKDLSEDDRAALVAMKM